MMAATPTFIRAVPEEAELLYIAPESLFDDIVKSEADRISRPENVRNRVVYDSVGDPSQIEGSSFVPAVSPPGPLMQAWHVKSWQHEAAV